MRVRYIPAALAHLTEICDYIAKDNREAANGSSRPSEVQWNNCEKTQTWDAVDIWRVRARWSFLGSPITRRP
jgi:hypothetical protein